MTAEISNPEQSLCSVGHGLENGEFGGLPPARIDELECAAQALLCCRGPRQTERIFADVLDKMRARYERLREYEPLQADMWEARCIHAAGMGAIIRLADRELFRRVTPQLRVGGLQSAAPPIEDTAHMFDPPRLDTPRGRAIAAFRNTGAAWLLDARRTVTKAVTTDPEHPYRPLWRKMRVAQRTAHYACRTWSDELERRGEARLVRRPQKSLSAVVRTRQGTENMHVAARLAIVAGASYLLRMPGVRPSPAAMTAAMLADTERLDGFSSVNIHAVSLAFPTEANNPVYKSKLLAAFEIAESAADILYACRPVIDERGGIQPRLNLEGGLRRRSAMGLCLANFELYDDEDSGDGAREFFEAAGADAARIMRADNGAYRGSSVLLTLAAPIARDTIYAAWPSESLLE